MKERATTPTVSQNMAETQDTLERSSFPDGRVSCDQVVPLKERAKPFPTAWQDVAETQDTPRSPLIPDGRVSCDQVVPLKERAVPTAPVFVLEVYPTAWQDVAETQDTLESRPLSDGRVSCDQVAPLKERAATPVGFCPTAWQNVAETQDTLERSIPNGRVSWIDHILGEDAEATPLGTITTVTDARVVSSVMIPAALKVICAIPEDLSLRNPLFKS